MVLFIICGIFALFPSMALAQTAERPIVTNIEVGTDLGKEVADVQINYKAENNTDRDVDFLEISIISANKIENFQAELNGEILPVTIETAGNNTSIRINFPGSFKARSTLEWTIKYNIIDAIIRDSDDFLAIIDLPRMPWALEENRPDRLAMKTSLGVTIETIIPEGLEFYQSIPIFTGGENEKIIYKNGKQVVVWSLNNLISRYQIRYGEKKPRFTMSQYINFLAIIVVIATFLGIFLLMRVQAKKK